MTIDPMHKPMTVDTKELRALRAKMTLGTWYYVGDGQIEAPDPGAPEFPWLIAETVPDDDAAGIVALVNAAEATWDELDALRAEVGEWRQKAGSKLTIPTGESIPDAFVEQKP